MITAGELPTGGRSAFIDQFMMADTTGTLSAGRAGKKWQPVGKGTSLAISRDLACPTPSERPIENNGEIRHLSNRFDGAKNENPGALAGASGANVKAEQLQAKQYTDAPNAARRVNQNGNWNRARWGWLKAITGDSDLSPMARLLAHVLATQFSHHETAHCAPGTDTLADALATSVDTIKRALRDLAAAGWLIRTEGRGRGNRSEIFFLGGNNVVPMICPKGPEASSHDRLKAAQAPTKTPGKGGNPAPLMDHEGATKKGADMRGKGGKSAPSYIKADPKNIQRERERSEAPVSQQGSRRMDFTAYDRATTAANAAFDRQTVQIDKGSHNEEGWNRWLAEHGFPSLTQLDQRAGAGWAVPFRVKPAEWDAIENRIAERWANWAVGRMQVRANA